MCLVSTWRCYCQSNSSNFSNFCNWFFFSENSLILNIFKWIGVIYILYLAYDIYKSRPKNLKNKHKITKSNLSFFRDGFLVAGTSPKAWMFFLLYFHNLLILAQIC